MILYNINYDFYIFVVLKKKTNIKKLNSNVPNHFSNHVTVKTTIFFFHLRTECLGAMWLGADCGGVELVRSRVCLGLSWLWAEFARDRVCKGSCLLVAEMSRNQESAFETCRRTNTIVTLVMCKLL